MNIKLFVVIALVNNVVQALDPAICCNQMKHDTSGLVFRVATRVCIDTFVPPSTHMGLCRTVCLADPDKFLFAEGHNLFCAGHVTARDTVCVIGSSHSATLVLMNLLGPDDGPKVINLHRSPLKYAWQNASGKTVYDYTGLKVSPATSSHVEQSCICLGKALPWSAQTVKCIHQFAQAL